MLSISQAIAKSNSSQVSKNNEASHIDLSLPVSTKYNLYPLGETWQSVNHKINELVTRKTFLSGPNCWGTVAFLLGFLPSLRYVSDLEYIELFEYAKIISPSESGIPNGAVLSIWSNNNNLVEHHHVALVTDMNTNTAFEKPGPNYEDIPVHKTFEEIISEAKSSAYKIVKPVQSFNQPNGKYAIFLDFSDVPQKLSSEFEKELSRYHEIGLLLNAQLLAELSNIYKKEINKITSARELSLAEGFYYLLKSMEDELIKINTDCKKLIESGHKKEALKLSKILNSPLQSNVCNLIDLLKSQIHAYRVLTS